MRETGAVLFIEGYQPPKFIYDRSLINGLLLQIADLGYESEYDVNLDERLDLRDLVEAISRSEGPGGSKARLHELCSRRRASCSV